MKTKEAEKKIIERALATYFPCLVCQKLEWAYKCVDKGDCGHRLYKLLEWHLSRGKENGKRIEEEDLYIRFHKPEQGLS
jgi:hypothetical protein